MHAYLIIAHNEFGVLQRLVSAIDDARNDIYVHFDAKVVQPPRLQVSRSRLYLTRERVDVRWADFSMVEAEFVLFKAACRSGRNYSRLHLLSGVDLPLRSQNAIHRFFDAHVQKEFIDYCLDDVTLEMRRKMQLWHLFPSQFKPTGRGAMVKRGLRALFVRLQLLAGFRRNSDVKFYKGSQWVSLTQPFVNYVLEREEQVRRIFSHTFCPDEAVWQTLCMDSPFRDSLYDVSSAYKGHMRLIDWQRGRPYVWHNEDYDELIASDRLFARKFSDRYPEVADRLYRTVTLPHE